MRSDSDSEPGPAAALRLQLRDRPRRAGGRPLSCAARAGTGPRPWQRPRGARLCRTEMAGPPGPGGCSGQAGPGPEAAAGLSRPTMAMLTVTVTAVTEA